MNQMYPDGTPKFRDYAPSLLTLTDACDRFSKTTIMGSSRKCKHEDMREPRSLAQGGDSQRGMSDNKVTNCSS